MPKPLRPRASTGCILRISVGYEARAPPAEQFGVPMVARISGHKLIHAGGRRAAGPGVRGDEGRLGDHVVAFGVGRVQVVVAVRQSSS